MSEEELKQAIEKLKHHIEYTKEFPSECFDKEIGLVINYINKLQKELEQEKEKNKKLNLENQALFESINCNDDNMLARRYSNLQKELNKKDKVINVMAEVIEECRQNGCIEFNEEIDLSDIAGEEMVKEYFYKKAEEENES